jgi:prepilin-type N-terminal cleavage/methylation domain-containing protein
MSRVRGQGGFSLVEVVVALSILSIGLLGLAGLMARSARRATAVASGTTINHTVVQQVNRLSVLPYDSLALGTTCKSINANGFAYQRCIRVDSVAVRLKRITLTITPTNTSIKPATEVFTRSKPAAQNVLAR